MARRARTLAQASLPQAQDSPGRARRSGVQDGASCCSLHSRSEFGDDAAAVAPSMSKSSSSKSKGLRTVAKTFGVLLRLPAQSVLSRHDHHDEVCAVWISREALE